MLDNSEWALGIVTGDNEKFISDLKHGNMEPAYRGADLSKYRLNEPSSFIDYTPDRFQQVAPTEIYRAKEKLIYKFISDSLVFAYDNTGALTLNSANILIPRISNYPMKLVMACLNSSILQFVYRKIFRTHKVLQGDLCYLPLPVIEPSVQKKILSAVEDTIEGNGKLDDIDGYLYQVLGITENEIGIIKNGN